MAPTQKNQRSKSNGSEAGNGHATGNNNLLLSSNLNLPQSETTGRYLVMMRQDGLDSGIKTLNQKLGLKHIANTSDFSDSTISDDAASDADAIVFDKIAVAVMDAEPEQVRSLGLSSNADNGILAIEPERIVYPFQQQHFSTSRAGFSPALLRPQRTDWGESLQTNDLPIQYLQGYRDAVNRLVDTVLESAGMPVEEAEISAAWNESEATWGLQATKVAMSRYSGKGIRIAVLDTGFDFQHPDFVGRNVIGNSFIPNEQAQDGHGHGTHCIGTACGPLQPHQLPRYGVAYEAEIFAGKVLSNQGSGSDGSILAGINWAIANGCHIISMSLGSRVSPGEGYSPIYETVAQRALKAGTLIIAAAGNESRRPQMKNPVGHPANCPSIMAVGALTQQMQVAYFSNSGINGQGGQVDIAGPGFEVISSWPRPGQYNRISGTSMATPHVAGIAALIAEANPGARGRTLANLLMQNAKRLPLPGQDVGAGLVQAP